MYQGLMAAYDPLEWFDYFYQYNNLNFVSDIMADDIYCGGSNEGDQPILVKTHYFTATSIDCCNQIWTIAYSGINRACVVLEYVDGVPGMSDQTKARYKAEATVLKAYYYTLLWKFWGNIPYYDKNLETPYLTAQLGHDEVYEKIVTRLQGGYRHEHPADEGRSRRGGPRIARDGLHALCRGGNVPERPDPLPDGSGLYEGDHIGGQLLTGGRLRRHLARIG